MFPLSSVRRTPRPKKRHLGAPTRRRAFGTSGDVDLESDSEELRDSTWERMVISGLRGPISKRHPWEHGFLVLFQNSNVIPSVTPPLNDLEFDDAGGFSDDDFF